MADSRYKQRANTDIDKTLEFFTRKKTGEMRATSVGGEILTLLRPSFSQLMYQRSFTVGILL